MPLTSLFKRDKRAAQTTARMNMLNDHMLQDIGVRRIRTTTEQGRYAAPPFTRYADL